jgi:hypothetical protein
MNGLIKGEAIRVRAKGVYVLPGYVCGNRLLGEKL